MVYEACGGCARRKQDCFLARCLFPQNRLLYGSQMEASIQCGLQLFDRRESGHPSNVGRHLGEHLVAANCENLRHHHNHLRQQMETTMTSYERNTSRRPCSRPQYPDGTSLFVKRFAPRGRDPIREPSTRNGSKGFSILDSCGCSRSTVALFAAIASTFCVGLSAEVNSVSEQDRGACANVKDVATDGDHRKEVVLILSLLESMPAWTEIDSGDDLAKRRED